MLWEDVAEPHRGGGDREAGARFTGGWMMRSDSELVLRAAGIA